MLATRFRSQLEAFDKIVDHAATSIADPACPQSSSRAAELDALSLADVADDVGLGELARLFRRRDSQGEFAEEPGGVSLLFVAQQRAISVASSAGEDVRSHRLAGGLDCLVARVAAGIADTIATDEPLLSVEHSDHQVTVTTSKRRIDADAMVLACSLVPLRAVRFDPPLPSLLADAVHRLGYGTVTKTAVQFAERQWQAGYATTEGISQRVYEPTVDQSGVAGALMSYAGGDGGRRLADHSRGGPHARWSKPTCVPMHERHRADDRRVLQGVVERTTLRRKLRGLPAGAGHRLLGRAATTARPALAGRGARRDMDRLPRGCGRERRKSCG